MVTSRAPTWPGFFCLKSIFRGLEHRTQFPMEESWKPTDRSQILAFLVSGQKKAREQR
jgi:hypothetical protein